MGDTPTIVTCWTYGTMTHLQEHGTQRTLCGERVQMAGRPLTPTTSDIHTYEYKYSCCQRHGCRQKWDSWAGRVIDGEETP